MFDGKAYLFSKRVKAPERFDLFDQPIVFQVQNTTNSPFQNIVLYGSLANRGQPNSNLPFIAPNIGVFATSLTPNIGYDQLLGNSENKPFKVGRTLVISSSAGQIEQVLTITAKSDDGEKVTHSIVPVIDPFQPQVDRLIDDFDYLMDGFGSITIAQLNALATVEFQLFLLKRFSGTRIADGKNPMMYSHR